MLKTSIVCAFTVFLLIVSVNGDNATTCSSPPEIEEAMIPDLDDTEHAVGTKIKYRCDIGYVSQYLGGFTSVCKFNEKTKKAEWTKPEISCSPRSCGDPGYVINGRRIGNLFTFPNKIEFECDEGYKLKGLKSRYCQAKGEWSGRRLPTCELIYCSEPANPVNGTVSYTSLGYGSELRYECNRGFVLKKHVTRVCAGDGKWNNEEPDCIEVTCEKPLPPERGSFQFSDEQAVGSLATYSCKEGTTLVGASSSECMEEGKWTFDPPKCLRSCKIPKIGNGVIGFLKTVQGHRQNFQEFVQFQVGETVKHNETVTVHCNEGFKPVNLTTLPNGDNNVLCNDGVWSKSMQCAPSKCEEKPPDVRNGIIASFDRKHGSKVQYQCDESFVMERESSVVCNEDKWEGDPPLCQKSKCEEEPPRIQNGRVEFFEREHGSEVRYRCDENFEILKESPVVCNVDKWEGDPPQCQESKCKEKPPDVRNGRIASFDRKHGSKVQYQCNESFVMKRQSSVFCNVDKWEGDPPLCQKKVTCEKPLQHERGSVQFSDGQAVGSSATYLCKEGTTLVGAYLAKCSEEGKWTFDPPKCLRSCKIPEIGNGVIGFLKTVQRHRQFVQFQVGETAKHMETVTVRCNEGFIPVNLTTLHNGDNYVSCNDGVWSKSMQCAPSRCLGDVPYLENATPKVPNNLNGSVIWYTCKEGFERLKTGHVQCVYGTWKGQLPVCGDTALATQCGSDKFSCDDGSCIEKEMWCDNVENCADRSDELYCSLRTNSRPNPNRCNRTEFFLCNNGRCVPKNGRCDGFNSCGDNSDEERCGNSKCEEEPPGIRNGRIASFDRKHGSKVQYQCDESFVMKRESSVFCNVDKWEGDPPLCQKSECMEKPPDVRNGKIAFFDRKHGSKVQYQCDESFVMERESSVFCNVDKWEGDPPLCQKSNCKEEPPRIQNGRADFFEREHGSEVRYRCDENFEILRESSVVCNVDKWEGDPPQCQEIGQIHDLQIKPEQQNNLDREKHSTTTEVPRSTSSSVASDTCYCTYDYPDDSVIEHSENRPVDIRRVIRKGESVSLSCRHPEMAIVWTNGLSFHKDTVVLACDTCKNWIRADLPRCRERQAEDSFLLFNDYMKILPGGIVEIPRHKNIILYCKNYFAKPKWYPSDKAGTYIKTTGNHQYHTAFLNINEAMDSHAGTYDCYYSTNYKAYRPTTLILKIAESEIQCPLLEKNTSRGLFNIHYENNRTVHSVANYACVSRTQKLIGPTSRECMANGNWSGSYPSCEDITCPWFLAYNSLVVAYTNNNKVNSTATFRCDRNARLIGSYSAVCMPSGQWSNQRPTCEMLEIRCPALNGKGIFSIYYDNDRRNGSNAAFHCIGEGLKVSGCAFRTCQENGEWSGDDPTCVDYGSCNMFEKSENLEVYYSNDIEVGSIATFSCVSPYTLVGNHQALCLLNRTWNSALPSCETPKCSVDRLFDRLPQEVFPDLKNVTDDYVPYGIELQFVCAPNLFLSGSSKTKCGSQGKWEHGTVRCIQGCTLGGITSTSQLLVEPVKDYYFFGETITFSCPEGQKLSSEIQRVMCLGKLWSDSIPDCEAAPQA